MQANRVLASWLSTRSAMRFSADGLTRRRARLWQRLQPVLRRTPALAPHAGRPLSEVPIHEVADLRGDYGAWNSLGLSHEALHAAAVSAERGGSGEVLGVVVGYSTGSSGQRGLFVADADERADYIGQSLARLLPLPAFLRPIRIALFLRANSRLYSDVGGRRVSFAYFPLDKAVDEEMAAFRPTIVIAPSHKLLELAAAVRAGKIDLTGLERCFYGAEPMSGAERLWIGEAIGVRPDPIYQATEGFLGAACGHGRLHLNEHSLAIELEPIAGITAFLPIVTDLRRRSQPIVRVRTDDVIELDGAGCACGYAGRAILPVAGRVSDLWRLDQRVVTPREVTDCLDRALGVPTAWQADGSRAGITLTIHPDGAARAEAARTSLARMLDVDVPVALRLAPPAAPDPKRRRVRWSDVAHG